MTEKTAVSFFPENVPEDLKQLKQWVCWGDGKVPVHPKTGQAVSSKDPKAWESFQVAALHAGKFQGVGFVFTKESGVVGIDLDNCFLSSGELKEWALKVLSRFHDSYCEVSPSGRGLHILVRAVKKGTKCRRSLKNGGIEVYDSGRYFTVTGRLFDPGMNTIKPAQDALDLICEKVLHDLPAGWSPEAKVFKPGDPKDAHEVKYSSRIDVESSKAPVPGCSDCVLEVIRGSTQADKFKLLTDGPLEACLSAYDGDHSRAVFALSGLVAFYTADFSVMDGIFRGSCLYSGKWAPSDKAPGKWERLGSRQFSKQRKTLEAKGDIYDAAGGLVDPKEDFSPQTGLKDFDKYVGLLLESYEDVRRDLLTESLHGFDGKEWKAIWTKPELGYLKGKCQAKGKKFPKARLEDYLYMYQRGESPELLIDVPAWDGRSRLESMSRLLSFEEESLTPDIFSDLLKDWAARMWARLWRPESIQNRCIILSGAQGIGKDIWIQSLWGAFGPYFSELTLKGKFSTETDIACVVEKSLVIAISEFDKTKNLDLGTLKDLITKPFFSITRKYDRDASRIINRASFIGACNPENVLRDVSGNRRFIVCRLEGGVGDAIRWGYKPGDRAESLQAIAEARELADRGFKANCETERVIGEIVSKNTPPDPRLEIVEEFEQAVREMPESGFGLRGLHPLERIDSTVQSLGKAYGLPVRTILTILKEKGCQYRTMHARLYGSREACVETQKTLEEKDPDLLQ